MIVEHATHPQFLSNTYLVADGAGGPAFFIDAGGPVEGLIDAAERLGLEPTHVLLTHHHFDHVSEVPKLRERWPQLKVLIHPLERDLLGPIAADTVNAGETLELGALEVRPLHTPGHTAGMLSFLVGDRSRAAGGGVGSNAGNAGADRGHGRAAASIAPGGFAGGEAVVFTGDTLFKGSVGGVRAPGHTTYTDLRDSIMGTLMELPPNTVVHPGHAEPSTVAREWEKNGFIRVWRGLDPQGSERCVALGEPATLILLGEDYDGGKKAWVRWEDGKDDIVPGSQVTR
ncbi:MAG TPA: MBL fold metallo-hydrolase [Solirubrobacteraceae bacterium]|jgi:glyoxylase-like metal-dependent hydrolase (beta-lactamase superfamily II)